LVSGGASAPNLLWLASGSAASSFCFGQLHLTAKPRHWWTQSVLTRFYINQIGFVVRSDLGDQPFGFNLICFGWRV
jgi:hypothetical protein